jgi:hypothetical protein
LDFSSDHWFKYEFDVHDPAVFLQPLTNYPSMGDGVISAIDEVWFEGLYQLQHPGANFTGDKHLDHHDRTAAVGTIRVEGKK